MKSKEMMKLGAGIVLSEIPIIGSVYSELSGYFENEKIKNRLEKLEKCFAINCISADEIQTLIGNMGENDYYVLRNQLKFLIQTAIPDVAEILNKAIVDFIKLENKRSFTSITTEIITELNSDDLALISKIKMLIDSNYDQSEKASMLDEHENIDNTGSNRDRFYVYGTKTIFYKDFLNYCAYFEKNEFIPLDQMLFTCGVDTAGTKCTHLVQEARSFVKLQNIGVLSLDFVSTLGTISVLNIDRFHLTEFGLNVLEYI